MDKIELITPDIIQENIEKLGELFPQVLTEVQDEDGEVKQAVDFDTLKDLLGDVAEGQRERYQFTWPGKREAKAEARRPINKTMIPCPEKSVNWDDTENLYIEGDNLDALKLMKETYAGKVKLIYIDPPYNTGNDFIYDDDFAQTRGEYDAKSGEFDVDGGRLVANPESNGRFHSDWCTMIYPRILLARDLLHTDGVLFISIDDNEYGNLKRICDEIFGGDCFVGTIHCQLSTTQGMKVKAAQQGNIVKNAEYILIYSRNGHKNIARHTPLYDLRRDYDEHYSLFLNPDGTIGRVIDHYDYRHPGDCDGTDNLNISDAYSRSHEFAEFVKTNLSAIVADDKAPAFVDDINIEQGRWYEINHNNRTYILTRNSTGKLRQMLRLSDSWGPTDGYYSEVGLRKIRGDWWDGFYIDMGNVSREGDTVFKNGKKPVRLIKQLIKMCCDEDALILDFFSGSATTGHAIMSLNAEDGGKRRFILVQIPERVDTDSDHSATCETICDLGEERLRRSGNRIAVDIQSFNDQSQLDGIITQIPDIGFRVLKIDSSNFRDTYLEPGELSQESIYDYVDNLKEDRTPEDLLFQVLPAFRIPYSAYIETLDIDGHTCFNVNDRQLIACFDTQVSTDVIEQIARLKPIYAVFRDASLADDSTAANFEELFKTYSPDTVRRVI